MSVLLFHVDAAATVNGIDLPAIVSAVLSRGYIGVDFFFVLSGFIIYHAHYLDEPGRDSWFAYLIKRAVRIYVPYLPVGLAFLSLTVVLNAQSAEAAFTSITLLPSSSPPALYPAWTLVHEVAFYGVFSLFFYFRRVFPFLMAAWAALIVFLGFGHQPETGVNWEQAYFSLLNLDFILGMMSAWVVTRLSPRWWPLFLTAGVLICFGAGVESRPLLGVGLGLTIVGMVCLERTARLAVANWVLVLGSASYALYLVHSPIVVVTVAALSRYGLVVAAVAAICLSLMAGMLYHTFVEKPALRFVRRQAHKPTTARVL